MNNTIYKLILVTDYHPSSFENYLHFISLAIKGGVTQVQLRNKTSPLPELRRHAIALQSVLTLSGIPLIINDYVDLAVEINAAGVHLGQSDLSPYQAREMLGSDKIIGYSLESMADLERANQLDCINYVAASAVFPSHTKTDCKTIWGLEGLKVIAQQSRYPVIAIGGIDYANANAVIKHGAQGIAVVSAIHDAPEPLQAARTLIQAMQQGESV